MNCEVLEIANPDSLTLDEMNYFMMKLKSGLEGRGVIVFDMSHPIEVISYNDEEITFKAKARHLKINKRDIMASVLEARDAIMVDSPRFVALYELRAVTAMDLSRAEIVVSYIMRYDIR
jgi:hypothetical protein